MNEKELIIKAQNSDISAMKKLADYYKEKTKLIPPDKLNDVIWMKDYRKRTQAPDIDEVDKKYKALAYKYYRMAAEAGDAESMTGVASFLYDAIGVERNQEEAYEWYRRGAKAGDPAAMRVTAYISEDEKDKFKWYKLSAELDKPGLNKQDSIKQTAINYACGRGTEKDIAKAEEWLAKLDKDDDNSARMEIAQITGESSWLEQAAESSPTAMIRMAEDFVLKNDFVTALNWYKKAARTTKKGAPNSPAIVAMSIIGDIYYIGEDGVDQDYEEAFKWYSRAAAQGYNMAKIKMTLMLYRGLGVKQDLQQAFKNFSEISWTQENFGPFSPFRFNSVARYYAAKMRENGEGCTADSVDTFERYRVAAGLERVQDYESPRRIPKAIYKVADAYFLGEGARQNFAKALNFYEKTLTKGDGRTPYHREAIKKVMWMYELGEGIPKDKVKAAEWRKKLNGSDEE
ncbi:MAG: sel1 repeat family protein [Selenomonadaceae bacterium]|nr:sel1 repeat family protein [Selenomonadaceae bacterium]